MRSCTRRSVASRGARRSRDYVADQRERFPGLRAAVHDQFASTDGTRECFRLRLTWDAGSGAETHSVRLRDGLIVEQVVGVSTFDMAKVLLVDHRLEFARDVPDPAPEIELDGSTLGRRFVRAFDARDLGAFDALFTPDTEVYTPLAWPVTGLEAVKAFVDEFHAANPGLRVRLHDEFESAAGTRVCWRIRLHFHNTMPFFGNPPDRRGRRDAGDARDHAPRRSDRLGRRRRQRLRDAAPGARHLAHGLPGRHGRPGPAADLTPS
jgi:SnoaL-like domain